MICHIWYDKIFNCSLLYMETVLKHENLHTSYCYIIFYIIVICMYISVANPISSYLLKALNVSLYYIIDILSLQKITVSLLQLPQ